MNAGAANVHLIGPRLREQRQSLGLSIVDLAKSSRVHRNTISSIERGLLLSDFEALARVADALGVDLEDLARPAPSPGTDAGQ